MHYYKKLKELTFKKMLMDKFLSMPREKENKRILNKARVHATKMNVEEKQMKKSLEKVKLGKKEATKI
jgi:hypothetical protein